MSIGLLLLALYGKEIANFTKELFEIDDNEKIEDEDFYIDD